MANGDRSESPAFRGFNHEQHRFGSVLCTSRIECGRRAPAVQCDGTYHYRSMSRIVFGDKTTREIHTVENLKARIKVFHLLGDSVFQDVEYLDHGSSISTN